MLLETPRLILRPVTQADTGAIAKVVFSDPNVVGMLAHNTKEPDDAVEEAKRWTSIMGIDGDGGIWENGGMGLFAVLPRTDGDTLAGVAGFYMEQNECERWNGEYFYALGTKWHGQGLMSEVAELFGDRIRTMENLGVIYASYWDLINEASGRLLAKTGLQRHGRKPVTEEYDAERCRRMFDYDLWRLNAAETGEARDRVAIQAARRAGAFVAEGVLKRDVALRSLGNAYGSPMTPDALDMFKKAVDNPGMGYFEIRGDGEHGVPVNRLG